MGITDSKSLFRQSFFIPKTEWTLDSVPDMTGKVVIVTGGNTGIGFMSIAPLLRKGAKVYLAARSPEKAQAAIAKLKQQVPEGNVQFLNLDLGDVKKIIAAANEFRSREDRLDVLFNSAGVMIPPLGSKTADGYDLQMGTNVLGHFVFTMALMPVLENTAKSGGDVRVVTTSSSLHASAPKQGILFDNMEMKGYTDTMFTIYAHSKLGNVLFANELARRYKDKGIFSCSLNPGNIRSDLQRHAGLFMTILGNRMLWPIEYGPLTQLYAGTSPDVTMKQTGSFYIPWARLGKFDHPKATDADMARKLWEWCEEQIVKVTGSPLEV